MARKKKAPTMDRDRLKDVLVTGIDRILQIRSWISGVTPEERSVLLAARQTVINDSTVLDKILPNVGPYHDVADEPPPESHP
jgi:hypothetical protein